LGGSTWECNPRYQASEEVPHLRSPMSRIEGTSRAGLPAGSGRAGQVSAGMGGERSLPLVAARASTSTSRTVATAHARIFAVGDALLMRSAPRRAPCDQLYSSIQLYPRVRPVAAATRERGRYNQRDASWNDRESDQTRTAGADFVRAARPGPRGATLRKVSVRYSMRKLSVRSGWISTIACSGLGK